MKLISGSNGCTISAVLPVAVLGTVQSSPASDERAVLESTTCAPAVGGTLRSSQSTLSTAAFSAVHSLSRRAFVASQVVGLAVARDW